MDDSKVPIVPFPLNNSIAYVRVSVENFQLHATDCWLQVFEYDADDKFLNMSRVYVPPEIYSEWGTQDDYLVEFALDQLGFERKPEVNVNFPA